MPNKRGSTPDLASYVAKISAIHAKALAALTSSDVNSLGQVGEILEDTANALLDASEEVRLMVLAANRPAESEKAAFRIVAGSRC
jgi:hypothetical protein